MIATLPGEREPEFLLTVPFTPRNKQNLIGLMVARCDGPHLGEIVFLDLPKQEIIPGPMPGRGADQSGSDHFEGPDAVEPAGLAGAAQPDSGAAHRQTFLYVAPIYIQAAQARMPQLKKVALVVGNTLVYADTYEQALADLEAIQKGQAPPPKPRAVSERHRPRRPRPRRATADTRVDEIRQHLKRYRDLAAQGKWAEAGKELEAIEAIVKK